MNEQDPEICGLCGLPIGPDEVAKIPHPCHWPGEQVPSTDVVHPECESYECARAHLALTPKQREAVLRSI